jgi:serine/threonine protein kinase
MCYIVTGWYIRMQHHHEFAELQLTRHRDLKPENILMFHGPSNPHNFTAKIADFGFCGIDASNDLALRGGTCLWAAPKSPLSPITPTNDRFKQRMLDDVYSFGLVSMFIVLGGYNVLDMDLPGVGQDIDERKSSDWVLYAAQVALDQKFATNGSLPTDQLGEVGLHIAQCSLRSNLGRRNLKLSELRTRL